MGLAIRWSSSGPCLRGMRASTSPAAPARRAREHRWRCDPDPAFLIPEGEFAQIENRPRPSAPACWRTILRDIYGPPVIAWPDLARCRPPPCVVANPGLILPRLQRPAPKDTTPLIAILRAPPIWVRGAGRVPGTYWPTATTGRPAAFGLCA